MLQRARLAVALLGAIFVFSSLPAGADPVSTIPRITFSGNLDFQVVGATLRTASNGSNACSVTSSNSATLSSIPAGSNVVAAYLYWAGSGSTADYDVRLNGTPISADRTFSEAYTASGYNLQYFSGFEDVTSLVSGNGTYTFSDLSVTNTDQGGGENYCSVQAVVAGWGMVVIYENPAEPLRVINMFDGFEQFRGSQIDLTPSNFVIPTSPIDGKIGVLSWEGDVQNSAPLNGVTENLVFDGESVAPAALTDGLNPLNNQFNSTINDVGSSSSWGFDLDTYDISSYLRAGDTTADTTYASGGDLVFLSLQIVSVTSAPAADLAITKSHTGNFSTAATNEWAIDVTNNGPSPETALVTVTDTLAAGLTYTGFNSTDANWTCSAAGQDVTCTHPGPIASGAALATLNIEVDADVSTMPSVANTASVSSPTFDYRSSNDTASDTANVLEPVINTSSKTVIDLNGGVAAAGDTLRYRVRVTESAGAAVSGVSLTDTLDPLLTNLVIVDAAGGTDNSTGTTVDITDIAVPASGFVDVTFNADIVGSAVTGDVIANSADLTNPATGAVTTVTSTDVVVGFAGVPATGIKPLYFVDFAGSTNSPVLPMPMSRTPLTSPGSPTRVRIRRQDNDRFWNLTPALQADFSIDAAPIPVYLQMRRNGSPTTRNMRVSVDYVGAASGFFGCVDVALSSSGAAGLSNTVTREFLFTVPRTDASCNPLGAAPLTLPAGTTIRVQVDNEPVVGPGGQAVFVYPYSDAAPLSSRAEIPATTVINIDTAATLDAPGGSVQTSFAPGDTVYFEADVSDPFGTFDIAGVDWELFDPSGTSQASGSMTVSNDPGGAVQTLEGSVALAAAAQTGIWTLTLTANEGTEGTVSHSITLPITVALANITLEKFVSTVSDPISGTSLPKSIPEAVLEYVIRVTNDGPTVVDNNSVFIRDALPAEMRLFFGAPVDPVTFVDGTPASGLTFVFLGLGNGTDDISFSNDGGSTFITPSVDIDGFDATTPPINYLEINPKGTFAAPAGSGSPNFELRFQMRLE